MDLFMRNIQFAASNFDVELSLASILHKPPFPTDIPINFQVHTFKTQRGRCGVLTLPTRAYGETFLRAYGSTGINVKGRAILFTESNKPLNQARLNVVLTTAWRDPQKLQRERQRIAQESTPIHLQAFCFGRFCRDGAFSMEISAPGRPEITCDLGQRQIRLTLTPSAEDEDDDTSSLISKLMQMSFLGPATISASYNPSKLMALVQSRDTDLPRLFLRANAPPVFVEERTGSLLNDSVNQRRPSLSSTQVMPPGCHSMCLTFQSTEDLEIFVHRCTNLGLERVYRPEIVLREDAYSANNLSKLDEFLGNLEFGLAFAINKAVASSILSPAEVLSLRAEIDLLQRDFENKSSQIFDRFSTFLHDARPKRKKAKGGNSKKQSLPVTSSLPQHFKEAIEVFVSEQNRPRNRFAPSPESAVYYSYHIILTPSAYILEGPLPDQSNSVLRRFGHHECFLRVSFQDDNRSPLRREPGTSLTELLNERFRPVLVKGLRVAGRRYEFLGYSMSGLRDHSVWFVSPFVNEEGVNMNAGHIRSTLGDFSRLAYQPARLGARWSQAFSTTDPSVTLESEDISKINDRVSPMGNVMTDGCGTISEALSKEVWSNLRKGEKRRHLMKVPSAYQIRLGGAKGVVVQDRRLTGRMICLRSSQTKFDAPDIRTLDIQSTSSRPKAMYLNRPLIVLLEYLGTDCDRIISLQDDSISEAQAIHHSFLDASKMFQQHGFGNSFRLSSLFHNLATLLDLHIDDNSQDSVVWSNDLVGNTLHCASTHALRELKYRAHIAVPGSYTLLGVSDEWGCLREGEIYATVQDERTGLYKPIEGPVVITRSPQVHPGDLQCVTAVRRPELSHLTNVVVFSCEGDRSLASCLAGGDLDGDDFNLILDEALFPDKVAMPGAYDSLPIKQTTSPCGISDVVDFVMNYIESDLIGYISILHLRFADIKDPGCNECLKLAQFASHAVDYPKTGSPVKMQDLPQLPGKERPDFLAREGANLQGEDFYQSQKLLGKLYRRVPVSEWIPAPWNRDYSPSDGGVIRDTLMRFDFRQLDLPSLDTPSDDLIEEMSFLLDDYSEQLLVIAKTHTISRHKDIYVSEAELVSGTIMANWSDHRKRREAIGAMNLQTQVLAKNIRQALQWSDPDSYYDDEEGYEEDYEEYDEGNYYSKAAGRNESFRRAWAAWQVAEEALNEEPGIFGPQSFGLIALTRMLDIIKEAQQY